MIFTLLLALFSNNRLFTSEFPFSNIMLFLVLQNF